MASLANKALLTSLNISQWTARRLDKRQTEDVNYRNSAAAGVARVNKSLLPGATSLERIAKKSGEIRAFFDQSTLPWAGNNMHILKSDGYFAFAQAVAQRKSQWWQLVDDFVREYPQLVVDAQRQLGSMYDPEDYPHPTDIRDRFNIDVRFAPVPESADWRIDLGDDEMAELRQQVERDVRRAQGDAMREAWDRLYDCVKHAADRLGDPDSKFRDSLVSNAEKLCRVLPSLNLADDPDLEARRQELESTLCGMNAKDLRKYPEVRADTAAKMRDIMAKMSGIYGQAAA